VSCAGEHEDIGKLAASENQQDFIGPSSRVRAEKEKTKITQQRVNRSGLWGTILEMVANFL
jgi:hypothetical protein